MVTIADSLDMEGQARVRMDTVDLGCYESNYHGIAMPVYNGVVYVTQTGAGDRSGNSWANALSSITDALSIASMVDADVWVAQGTYYGENNTLYAFKMIDGVNVYGGFAGTESELLQRDISAHPTILDGQNSRRVLYQQSTFTEMTVWDGFTLQHVRLLITSQMALEQVFMPTAHPIPTVLLLILALLPVTR